MSTKKTQKIYEVSFHLIPKVDNPDKKCEEITGIITGNGEVISSEAPERINLAYTIRHTARGQDGLFARYDEAFFGSVKFKAGNDFVERLRQTLHADNDVLRFLIAETVEGDTRIGPNLPDADEEGEKQEMRPGGNRMSADDRAGKGDGKNNAAKEGETNTEKDATLDTEAKQ